MKSTGFLQCKSLKIHFLTAQLKLEGGCDAEMQGT
jgi:hypothetical protein